MTTPKTDQTPDSNLPSHVGFILDGNRRWAKANGLPTLEGHRRGLEVFRETVKLCLKYNIPYVSAYVFSTENWSRTQDEVSYLMTLLIKAVEKYLDEFNKLGVRIQIIGSQQGLDKKVIKALAKSQQVTASNDKLTVGLCFNYGGHQEIVDAVKKALSSSDKQIDDLTAEDITSNMYASNIPPCDLIIRTSGEQRLSGFMLWRSAYSEFKFINKLWPDFGEDDFVEALNDYSNRQRRMGK